MDKWSQFVFLSKTFYMVLKNQKLHEQFDAAAASSSNGGSSSKKSFFSGVSIFVDGYTVPSSQELRGYMLKYGGRFENYFARSHVTHIICSNLPSSKIKNLRAFSGGLPVVKPTWVLDSVAASKLLSWMPYQLDQLSTENDSQRKLSAFFTLKSSGISDTECPPVDGQVTSEKDNSSSSKVDSTLFDEHDSLEKVGQCSVEPDELLEGNRDKLIVEEPAHSDVKRVELSNISPSDGRKSGFRPKSSTCQTSVSFSGNNLHCNSDGASGSRTTLSPIQHHSSLSDPKFVDNYFKSSRLHFIGTWRNRYRNRFPRSSNGFTFKNPTLNTDAVTQKTAIIHIDLDCFFVAVVIRNHPELQDKPVAVCHSDNPRGTAEISSANYPGRDHGVKAGMFVKDAKILCPQLVIVPYDFGAYEKVADQFYDILHKYCNKVQALSCDEAFLDVSESEVDDPQILASVIRKEIFDTTGCTVSAGIAGNMLLARLATKTAKPNGQYYLPPGKVDDYLCSLPVKALPGIGHVLEEKLTKIQAETCGQLRLVTKEFLQKEFGTKTGEMLWNHCRGIDNRLVGVIQESKSIGAEVNWGVRFRNPSDSQHFLASLCKEVALRLQGCGVQGRSFTLKIKKRKLDSGEPVKYLGCGDCENLSHSTTIPVATNDADALQRLATQLFGYFHIDIRDIRGMGLQVSKLEGSDDSKLVQKRNSIVSWLASSSTKASDQIGGPSRYGDAGSGMSSSEIGFSQTAKLPPLHDLDMTVIESLPPEVVSEINDMYSGKLSGFISENKGKIVNTNLMCPASLRSEDLGVPFDEKESLLALPFKSNTVAVDNEEMLCGDETPPIVAMPSSVSENNLMPSSLSQVDRWALQQLPEELRKDIIEFLPLHRRSEFVKCSSSEAIKNLAEFGFESKNHLWTGNPPLWVDKFKISNCYILNVFANKFQHESHGHLSSLLQCMMFEINLPTVEGSDRLDDAVCCLCDLFKQYVDLKIETDMEEIYICICLLRRLSKRSNFFVQVYSGVLPHLQESMGEKYGGTLNIPYVKN